MASHFLAMMSRMKYIERWALMKNSSSENIAEHSLEVAMITHCLVEISNRRLGNHYDTGKAVMIAMYHDSTEIITGDMPTPIKYFNSEIQDSFKKIEDHAAETLLTMLPEDFQEDYREIFFPSEDEAYLCRLVKAADKLSALIKCIDETKVGNMEFAKAKAATEDSLREYHLPELDIFMNEFLPSYEKTLDELS